MESPESLPTVIDCSDAAPANMETASPVHSRAAEEAAEGLPVAGGSATVSNRPGIAVTDGAKGKAGPERVRWVRKQERRQRRLRQVFVRGNSIVLVSLAE